MRLFLFSPVGKQEVSYWSNSVGRPSQDCPWVSGPTKFLPKLWSLNLISCILAGFTLVLTSGLSLLLVLAFKAFSFISLPSWPLALWPWMPDHSLCSDQVLLSHPCPRNWISVLVICLALGHLILSHLTACLSVWLPPRALTTPAPRLTTVPLSAWVRMPPSFHPHASNLFCSLVYWACSRPLESFQQHPLQTPSLGSSRLSSLTYHPVSLVPMQIGDKLWI